MFMIPTSVVCKIYGWMIVRCTVMLAEKSRSQNAFVSYLRSFRPICSVLCLISPNQLPCAVFWISCEWIEALR